MFDQTSSPIFYLDDNCTDGNSAYVSYAITNNTGSTVNDLWVRLTLGAGMISLAANEDGIYHVGTIANGVTKYVYFYATSTACNGTNTPTNFTLNLYTTAPPFGVSVANCSFGYTVENTISATSNKVNVTTYTPNPPAIGGYFVETVTGFSGNIGNNGIFAPTPNVNPAWPATTFRLESAVIKVYETNVAGIGNCTFAGVPSATYTQTLFLQNTGAITNGSTACYTIEYRFVIQRTYISNQIVSPMTFISSGMPEKHNDLPGPGAVIQASINTTTLAKSASPTSATSGGTITYTITATNTGTTPVFLDSFKDTLPAGMTYVNNSSTFAGVGIANPTISGQMQTWNGVFQVPAGGTASLVFQATLPANVSCLAFTNEAVAFVGISPNTTQIDTTLDTTDNSPATATVADMACSADLVINKTDGATSVNANGTTTYTVTVTNNGPAAANGATIGDPAAAGLAKTAIGTCTAAGGAVCPTAGNGAGQLGIANLEAGTVVIPTLPSGGSISFTITANVTVTSGSVTNTATVTNPMGIPDPNPVNNSSSDTNTIIPITDLAITKTDGSLTYTAGNAITYTIVVSNNGPSNATGASVGDAIPASITGTMINCVATGTASCGTNASAGNNLSFTGVNINAGAGNFITITVSGTINPATTGDLVNTATVAAGAGQPDPTPGNNSATDTDTPNPQTDLAITKNDGSTTYTAGNAITYTIVVSNNGPSNATGASVSDAIPASITGTMINCAASGTASCGTNASAGNNLSFTGVNIAAGAGNFITITVSGTVNPATTGNLVNTATVAAGAGQNDPTPGNNSATDTDTPAPQTDLAITKTDGSATYTAGNAIEYTIVVSNNGPSNATGASVADTIPASITGTVIGCVATGTASCGTNASAGNNLSFTGVNINAGAANFITITITGTVNPATTGNLVNTVTVAAGAGQNDPTPGNNSATDTDTPNPQTDLAITKTDGSATYTAGNAITYTIVVSNNGPSNATGASVSDTIPAAITGTAINCTATGTASCGSNNSAGNNLSFTGVNIAAGAGNFITITINGTVNPATTGNLVNTATVTPGAGQNDPAPVNNSATDTDGPNSVTDLSISKTDGSTTYTPGGGITYTIVVSNAGPSNATGVSVTDAIPAAITGLTINCVSSGAADCGANNSAGNNLSFTGVNIAAGGGNFITITVSGTINPATTGNLVNTATVAAGAGQTDPNLVNNSATDTDSNDPQADLAITKTDGTGTYTAGTSTTYTIVVSNNGPSSVTGASVVDNLPAGVTGATWACVAGGGGSCATPNGTGNISTTVSLPPGATATFTVVAQISPNATGNLVNTATVTPPSGVNDPNSGNNSATDTNTPNPIADLSITKTDGATTYTPGGSTTYTIVVSNAGPSAVTNAPVTDTFPAAITSAAWTCTASVNSSCGAANGTGNIATTVSLALNGTATFVVTVQISAAATGNLVNTATVAAPAGTTDPTPGNNSASDTDTPAPVADLAVTKTDNSQVYTAGTNTVYTMVVTNNGPSNINGATVTDTLPAAQVNVAAASWTCTASAGSSCGAANGTGNIATTVNLIVGGTATFTYTVPVLPGATGNLTNTVTVAPPAGATDPNSNNNTATDTDTPFPQADLGITKVSIPATYTPGSSVVWTIVATNNGPSTINGGTVTDNFPAAVTSASWTCTASAGSSCAVPNGTGNINAQVSLLPNGAATFTVTAQISPTATGNLTNTATIATPPDTTDAVPGNNSATETDTPNPIADLSITKTDNSATYTPGGSTTYTIVVTNAGPSAVTGAPVSDSLPAAVTSASWTCAASAGSSCAAASGNGGINTTVSLLPTGTATFTLTVQIASSATGNLVNTAMVTAPAGTTDPNPANNNATDTDTPAPAADLSITKTHGQTPAVPGQTLTYTIVATNNGPSDVSNATINDTLPASLSNASWTCAASAGSSCGAASGTGNISATVSLLRNGTATFTLTATISAAATGALSNTATIATPIGTTDPDTTNNSATDTSTLTPQTDLAITKTDGSPTYTAGNAITYTIVVSNNGASHATGASVSDAIPASITGTTINCTASGTAGCGTNASAGNNLSFTGVNINAGAGNFITITVSGTINPATTGNLVNTATVAAGAGQTDPTPGNNSATDTDTPNPQTDLTITKTDGSPTYTAGSGISYTIVVSNNGPSNATGASVSDTIPASITGVTINCAASGTAGCGTNASAGNNLSFTGVNIAAGAGNFITITVSGTVNPATTGNLVNTVTVTAGPQQTDPTPGNNSATDTDTPNPLTDLAITKTDGSATYTAGNAITYTIVVTNNGPSNATGISVADAVPASITGTVINCTASGVATCGTNASAGNNLSFTGVDIPAGAANFLTITVSGTVNPATTGNLVNTATVTAGPQQTDPTPKNNFATDTDSPNPLTDLAITKTDGSATYTAGTGITYTIVVSNNGPSNAIGVSVMDSVPASITGTAINCTASGAATCGTNASAGNNLSFTGVNIPAGAANFLTITVSGTINPATTGNLVNTATVMTGPGQTDSTQGNNSATDTDTPNPQTDLAITKTDGSATYTAGTAITYTIRVSNSGPSNATGVTVADAVPASITGTTIGCVASGAATCGTNASAGNNVSFTGVNIAAGAANFLTITVSGTVNPATTGNLVNTATVTAGPQQTDPTTSNNSATDTDTPDPRADLSITKTDGSATYVPGLTTTYTIVVRNNGPSNITGASVTDPKPTQISSWTWTCLSTTGGATGCDGVTNSTSNFTDTVNLPAGATITYSVTANLLPGATGNLVNTVTVDVPTGVTDPNTSNNSATDTDTAAPLADLSLTKTVDNGVPDVGKNVVFTITVRNAGPSTATGVVVGDPLPAGLVFVEATPSQGSYNSATGLWTVGTIAPNGFATLQLKVKVNDPSAANIAEVAASDVPDPNSTPGNGSPSENDYGKVTFGSPKGPGLPISPRVEAADDKAGSVLVYNYYTSSASNPTLQNTRISITNTNPKMDIYVHLFFVDGTTCSVADNFICLTPNQTSFFLASDLDPGTSGYLIAVAVDENGCPINANCLIGDEYIKLESGHAGNLAAVSISAVSPTPAACDNSSSTAVLNFDGNSYNRLPTVLALDNISSRSDSNDTLLVLNRIGGNLGIGAGTLGTLFGILYDDIERGFSFSISGNCQIRSSLSNNFPRTAPRFETAIPAGRSGWMKLWSAANNAILGAAINFNPNRAGTSNAYGGAHNLNHLRLTDTASYVMPVFPPSCR